MVYCSHALWAFLWELGWILNEYFQKQIYWCCDVYMLFWWEKRQHLTIIGYISYFLCVLCTMWCFVWFLHEMVLLLHENLNYCTKHIWYLCKLQNKNFSMVCCTTLWWDGAGKGRGWKTAAIIYCWQQQHVRGQTAQLSDISSGATSVADLDSRALALTKEASGNSRGGDLCLLKHLCILKLKLYASMSFLKRWSMKFKKGRSKTPLLLILISKQMCLQLLSKTASLWPLSITLMTIDPT